MAARYVSEEDVSKWIRRGTQRTTSTGGSIALIIDGVERAVDDKCNTRFVETDFADVLVPQTQSDILQIPRCQSLSSLTIGGSTLVEGTDWSFVRPKGLPRDGAGYRQIRKNWGTWWVIGDILLTGKFGWKTVPPDMYEALLFQIEFEYVVRSGMQPLTGFPEGAFVLDEDGKPWHKTMFATMQRYTEVSSKIGAI